jgi:DNA (cytosine-5)-methyltransferase 1
MEHTKGGGCIVLDRAFYNQGVNALYDPQLYEDGTCPTIVAKGTAVVCTKYIVRRLTPTECARLQGFPDRWGDIEPKESFTDEEHRFWQDVRNTHAAINGKTVKDYTKEQMLKWYNKLHTDSAEYKMWGNGIALPTALYVMQGIDDALKYEPYLEGYWDVGEGNNVPTNERSNEHEATL